MTAAIPPHIRGFSGIRSFPQQKPPDFPLCSSFYVRLSFLPLLMDFFSLNFIINKKVDAHTLCGCLLSLSKNLCSDESARVLAGELEGRQPASSGANALNALLGKAFSERSEDFSAAQRRESNGIFADAPAWFYSPAESSPNLRIAHRQNSCTHRFRVSLR